ncbi:MAG: 1-deoxy-D-xylulose-5-phosphate synthase [Magnetococcales bacterium]|nr:1-deoxy-D-xylulose-5-phosphate synthase [Magnetococcales bacterium]
MRKSFIDALAELAARDPRLVLLTADLGYTLMEPFAARFPRRYFNVGVAEQNMVGMATGLADAGFIPYLYSMVPFLCLRPFEFIRNGPVLHRLPVRLAGPGGGFDYGGDGSSHHGLEDLGVLRTLQDITIVTPADAGQARTALAHCHESPGPVYFRLGKDESFRLPGLEERFPPEGLTVTRTGNKVVLITMGSLCREVDQTVDLLAGHDIHCTLAVVARPHPVPEAALAALLATHALAVTVEEHVSTGGLGSVVAEVVAERGLACRLIRRGVRTIQPGLVGSRPFLLEQHGLDPRSLARCVVEALR